MPSKKIDNSAAAVDNTAREFCRIDIERGLITSLRREAIARGTNAPALVRDLLGMIVSDQLVGAILDAD
jgi:hypothetical protein